jgi:hypothetical protein
MRKQDILLVEPNFPVPPKSKNHKNFLPVGLLKIGAYLQSSGKAARLKLARGNVRPDFAPDEIWVTSLFTYWSEHFWNSIRFYRAEYPDSIIRAGGIYVSLHFDNRIFRGKCKQYQVRPHFGVYDEAEKCLPDYTLISGNPKPLDYQIVHSARGCPRHCDFCYVWKLEPTLTSKPSLKDEICSNKLVFYDNNLLINDQIGELLEEISESRYQGKPVRCEAQSGFDGRILERRPNLAAALKRARFENPKIAWDGSYGESRRIERQIEILKEAGYSAKDIAIFMIFNWEIGFYEMERKRLKCWEWKVQINDCRYRPVTQLFDNFNARIPQTPGHYFIHPKWSDAEIKQFRRNVRRQNICVRQGLRFYSWLLEKKGTSRKLSREIRTLSKKEVVRNLSDAWFPDSMTSPERVEDCLFEDSEA